MNASQARALAKERGRIIDVTHRQVYVKIIDHIKKVLEKEECYAIHWDAFIPDSVIKMLQGDGYNVRSSCHRNETSYAISWAE